MWTMYIIIENLFITYLSLRFLLLFNNNKLEYSINNNTKQTIKELITSQLYGYIKISYYDNEKDNKILINLELFKHTNFLFKHTIYLFVMLFKTLLRIL